VSSYCVGVVCRGTLGCTDPRSVHEPCFAGQRDDIYATALVLHDLLAEERALDVLYKQYQCAHQRPLTWTSCHALLCAAWLLLIRHNAASAA
jgi:hypothetical protein